MTSSRQIVERRIHKRFRVPTGTYVALRPDYIKVGQIIDMSMDGLAFDYVGDGKKSSTASRELDILMLDGAFHLYKIPYRIISDFIAYQNPSGPSISMRRCGVHFGELTAYQSGRLEYFIENHTIGEA